MGLEARIEKAIGELRSWLEAPLAIELWNGKRFAFSTSPPVTLRVRGPRAARTLVNADLEKLGAAYVEGLIDVDGPIREIIRAAEALSARGRGYRPGRLPRLSFHSRRRDAAAIGYHYDVSNDFYALWLDREMVYSCAYFRSGDESLEDAQAQKLDHICRKLRLAPGETLLDIGCGWGALVRFAAKHYGVDATGITLSRNQHALATERIRAEGLEGRCRVQLLDYRDVPGEGVYDKIASVGMFEHVGLRNLPLYFGTIHRLLKDGGVALNHGITAVDAENRDVGLGGGAFVDRYVFPHGELPHLMLVVATMGAQKLEVVDVETLRLHYARTLWHWSDRLEDNLARARALTDERRIRIWRTYLAGCAHAFESNWVTIQQVLAVKSSDPRTSPLPLTRDWMYRSGTGQAK
ncbi:MAG: cyclopropane-fatty-acyl-phospholipid synthase family protein [Burkholderiales bacterium]|nr:cyclopropane-fatty-acyl-phospholipid synthase family protein [Burkholderiales bacterium]